LAEAVRVTRTAGLVCAAAISRYACPLYALRDRGALSPERAAAIATTIATGRGDPVGSLPDAYSHRPSELADELVGVGLSEVEILSIEGPGWPQFTPDVPAERVDALLDATLRTAELCDQQPDMTAASAHLLACARR
jgi:hypothetical protein